MSDNKHVQNEALWNRTSPAATRLPYNPSMGSVPAAVFVSGGGSISGMPQAPLATAHPDVNFAAARFQAPPIHHQQHHANPAILASLPPAAPPPTATYVHHQPTSSIASSNVPVFPANAAATSVLTPNPFATVTGTSSAAAPVAPTAAAGQFALQQFFQAMNTAAASFVSNPVSNNSTPPQIAPPVLAASPAAGNRQAAADLPSPASSSASAGGGGSVAGTSGTITATITENVLNAIGNAAQSATPLHGRLGFGVRAVPDEEKLRRVHQMVEAGVGEHAKQQILQILDRISTLKPVEKLLLYLRLPGAAPETDPLRQPQNPLGTRSEINHTINWVRSHLEQDPHVSIPKQDVYNDYIAYCERLDIKPLSTADFGKVMKQVFPGIRPRRLGTRGHSRYCYAAMRKTTKLTAPQLPLIGSASVNKGIGDASSGGSNEEFISTTGLFNDGDVETWGTIKTWAEGLLQIKLDDARDLATRIKTGNVPGTSGGILPGAKAGISHKKFGNRETKEKRLLTDMGPLKKRRKKKRKGSSSSESSYNSSQQPQPVKQNSSDQDISGQAATSSHHWSATAVTAAVAAAASTPSSNETPFELIKVKEEFIDSPNIQQVENLTPPNRHSAILDENYLQQQMLPMNLATEQRTALIREPTELSAFNVGMRAPPYAAAAKNLMPKIMELATASTETSNITAQQSSSAIPTIKEEDVDEYNTSNILCKKVRKAQQTKSFLQQTTATATLAAATPPTIVVAPPTGATINAQVVPVITTSAPTPTLLSTEQAGATVAGSTPSPVGNYLMGPPAAATSTSPFAAMDAGSLTPTPKVASRNMLQLRAKRIQAAAAAAAAANEVNSTPPDDLPENLGLPRERVISICNMDKHELDDYFLNGEEEEENSNDQDTELLQYFQTGDAEEKLNSLGAGKHRNPTAAAVTAAGQQTVVVGQLATLTTQQSVLPTTSTLAATSTAALSKNVAVTALTTTSANAASTTATITPAVGSASASLALMSQKHHQLQQQLLQQTSNAVAVNKRKLAPSAPNTKHCTFAPISPNINGNNGSGAFLATTTTNGSVSSAPINTTGGFFASPGITPTRLRPKPALLAKQQSLDVDLTGAVSLSNFASTTNPMYDPMIGASRRRRNFTANVTSASAPPSPSVLHQQQQQQVFHALHFQNAAASWQQGLTSASNPNNASFLNDQNSLDLDLFGSANGNSAAHYGSGVGGPAAGFSFDEYATETQRSQSVPLSQLQRIHSPPLSAMASANATTTSASRSCNRSFDYAADSNMLMCSENSSSQHSNSTTIPTAASIIKLEDPAAVDVMASDSAALLDGVDVSEILSSPDFVDNFTSIAQQQGNVSSNTTAVTTCSSAGSSSGYSSGACTTFSASGGTSAGIMSRSVPSTPLPHHHQNLFGQSSINFYSHRRRGGISGGSGMLCSDELQLSPGNGFLTSSAHKFIINNNHSNNSNTGGSTSFGNTFGSRSIYDISKSMPTTPITTPSFRYSPEFNRDFLINGNTIDDSISFGAVGSDSLMGGGNSTIGGATGGAGDDDSVNLVNNLNADTLLTSDDVSVPGADDVLLGNL